MISFKNKKSTTKPQGENYHIMIVDDDVLLGVTVSRHLDSAKYFKTHYFDDPQKALIQVPRIKPDMIILDWHMPELSGLNFLEKIREDTATKNVPVFMLTAKSRGADFEQACAAGVDGYLTKPVDFKALNERILRHFAHD